METISILLFLSIISNLVFLRAAVNVSIPGEIPKLLKKYGDTLSKNKTALRYGFQHTNECQDFDKAFLCITKCLDFRFDVAHADKNCKCVCYTHKEKADHTTPRAYNTSRWKLGAPTTMIPFWAQSSEEPEENSSSKPDIVEETLKAVKNKNPEEKKSNITHQEKNHNTSESKADIAEQKLKADKKPELTSSPNNASLVTSVPDISEQKTKTGEGDHNNTHLSIKNDTI